VPEAQRGKYGAFASSGSDGTNHLAALAAAGLTHVHILPAFDIATINEDAAERVDIVDPIEDLCAVVSAAQSYCDQFPGQSIADILDSYAGDSSDQQALVELLRGLDSFNWGYDPYHFDAPEGSYSSDPDGTARILEFRQMVMGLNDLGLRTIMDTVYNHTNASGHLSDKSVLDKVVPGYYHRLDSRTGNVLRESCCDDTAAEHAMMGKFIVDSSVHWARAYKVDGFRYDLMAFHPQSTMEAVGDALSALTIADDGVDGSTMYIYGEGWNFGEVGNDARFVQARQDNLAGTGIGSFNDRIRDAVRGGGPFDSGPGHIDNQGFISGLYVDPNGNNAGSADELSSALSAADRIRVSMAGGLADFGFIDASDNLTTGGAIGAGYTADPQEIVNYISSHDNETLWDIAQYKHPFGTSTADRVRAHVVGNAILTLGQGVPFMHAGQEMLRSKSMDRNSFDSGDWFNFVDFTLMDNNFAVGLPPSGDNSASYIEIAQILGLAAASPSPTDMMDAFDRTAEFLQIRNSTELFRLREASDVINRVRYYNTGSEQVPGLIVQGIDGCVDANFTPEYGSVVTVINARPDDQVIDLFGNHSYMLHPVQQASADPALADAFHDASGFNVPARTVAVFVEAQSNANCSFGAAFSDNTAFLTGDFNDNGFYNAMVQVGDTNWYEGTLALDVMADQRYRIQSPDMSAIDCGGPTGGGPFFTPVDAFSTIQCGSGPDQLSLDIASAGKYKFALDTGNSINPSLVIRSQVGTGFPFAAGGCGFADPGNDNTAQFGEEMFLRGNFTGWAADPMWQLLNMGDGTFQSEFELTAGNLVFKIAGADWSPEYGAPAGPMMTGEPQDIPRASGPGTDITYGVAEDNCYNFEAVPSANTLPEDNAPESLELTISVKPLDTGEPTAQPFVRGGFNGWGEGNPLTMVDATRFETTININAGDWDFKIASSDWATVNCGGPQDLGSSMSTSVDGDTTLSCGQNPANLTANFSTGDYKFTIDASNRANPTLTVTPVGGPTSAASKRVGRQSDIRAEASRYNDAETPELQVTGY
ncbi:MAG: pullulanase-type alpha-1,6-glucosidase, partial [Gammaproteobacteria bacterium]|nr:pullulanase-type alpha-1,6-glucosidase [Gammaproteobacteria bacterium]